MGRSPLQSPRAPCWKTTSGLRASIVPRETELWSYRAHTLPFPLLVPSPYKHSQLQKAPLTPRSARAAHGDGKPSSAHACRNKITRLSPRGSRGRDGVCLFLLSPCLPWGQTPRHPANLLQKALAAFVLLLAATEAARVRPCRGGAGRSHFLLSTAQKELNFF